MLNIIFDLTRRLGSRQHGCVAESRRYLRKASLQYNKQFYKLAANECIIFEMQLGQ